MVVMDYIVSGIIGILLWELFKNFKIVVTYEREEKERRNQAKKTN